MKELGHTNQKQDLKFNKDVNFVGATFSLNAISFSQLVF